ncbi:MAG TPA: reductive dehalogenase [Peptococcaceae bacterium]|nr:reductive dehalogenase [Peptococcaceae bacterium]
MDSEKNIKQKPGISRRSFLKTAGAIGAVGALASMANIPGVTDQKEVYAVTTHDTFPVELSEDFKRFDFKNVVFMRGFWDPKIQPIAQVQQAKFSNQMPPAGNPGYTEIDAALNQAAWAIHDSASPKSAYGIPAAGPLMAWDVPSNSRKYTFSDPEEASRIVKRAARFLGASLVGICDYDERWVYSHWYNPFEAQSIPVQFPFEPKSVIVIALEMNYEGIKTAPSLLESAAAGNEYSNMSGVSHKVATFLRQLGYKAANCGNDTALSVPLAIAAGLGEMSRMGMVITREYGPRVRLCKVFTDLELKADKPISFGVKEFCKSCLKCADSCPGEAISRDKEPSFDTYNISNHAGVKKWCVDAEKCYQFWADNGGDCGSCIASCPYNKIDEWHHKLSRAFAETPARSLLRYLDDAFGYGKVGNEQLAIDFWKK